MVVKEKCYICLICKTVNCYAYNDVVMAVKDVFSDGSLSALSAKL